MEIWGCFGGPSSIPGVLGEDPAPLCGQTACRESRRHRGFKIILIQGIFVQLRRKKVVGDALGVIGTPRARFGVVRAPKGGRALPGGAGPGHEAGNRARSPRAGMGKTPKIRKRQKFGELLVSEGAQHADPAAGHSPPDPKTPNLGPGPRGHSPGVAPSPPSPSRSQLRGRCSHPKSPQRPQKGGGRERFWGLGWAPPGRGHDPELLGHRTQALGLVFGVVLWGHGVGMSSGAVFWGHGVRVSSGCCHAAPPRKE